MAVGLSITAADELLTTLRTNYTWIKLHVGDPGTAGTLLPAVETDRVQATWSTPASAAMTTTAQLQWTAVAGTEDYTHFSAWTAATAGTFGFSGTITSNAVTSGDTFTIPTGEVDVSLPTAA